MLLCELSAGGVLRVHQRNFYGDRVIAQREEGQNGIRWSQMGAHVAGRELN